MSQRWQKASVVVGIIGIFLTGIPKASEFYPPLFAGFTRWLPIELLLEWSATIGPLLLAFLVGWIVRGRVERDIVENINSIEGCIEKEGVAWKGRAHLSNGQILNIEVPFKPICPQCQTPMNDSVEQTGKPTSSYVQIGKISVWECPNSECRYSVPRNSTKHEEAQNLFESRFKRITQSEGERYSLEYLIKDIDGELTPEKIWRKYVETVDDAHASISCFH